MVTKKVYTDEDLTPFGRRLKEAIEQAGYKPTGFGRAAGFSAARMTDYLYGDLPRGVSFSHLERMVTLTGVRVEWLAWGKEPMRGPPTTPREQAAEAARRLGVPEPVIAHVIRRYELAPWDTHGWLQVMMNANRRAAEDKAWYEEFRRVTMIIDASKAAKAEKIASARRTAIGEGRFSVEDALKEIASAK